MAKQEQKPAAEAAEAKPAGNKKLIIMMLVGFIVVGAASAGGVYFFLGGQSEPAAEEAAEPAEPVKLPALYEPLTPAFVVNYNHEGRNHYMQVHISLMARDQAKLDELKVHMPVLKNELVMLFSSQNFAELQKPEGKTQLRDLATAKVKEIAQREVGDEVVEQVLFTNFVLQ
ncbi:flagellar basal body-associated FliL family protein [Atopomonas sediminilitoris]|uniref:flagellar basal body-associated FliL family protein n=1 Tax=Atopomonas sediminilitoris TaxID=2919919 RepID=UPI001F4D64BE|nr:flagellar basal body-associated FliL family protein [Atopomonas sediminilitoris]MCJ8167943.1 flagellar basal body-associated protein FliL [Atopomonas sediminilitoris]